MRSEKKSTKKNEIKKRRLRKKLKLEKIKKKAKVNFFHFPNKNYKPAVKRDFNLLVNYREEFPHIEFPPFHQWAMDTIEKYAVEWRGASGWKEISEKLYVFDIGQMKILFDFVIFVCNKCRRPQKKILHWMESTIWQNYFNRRRRMMMKDYGDAKLIAQQLDSKKKSREKTAKESAKHIPPDQKTQAQHWSEQAKNGSINVIHANKRSNNVPVQQTIIGTF